MDDESRFWDAVEAIQSCDFDDLVAALGLDATDALLEILIDAAFLERIDATGLALVEMAAHRVAGGAVH